MFLFKKTKRSTALPEWHESIQRGLGEFMRKVPEEYVDNPNITRLVVAVVSAVGFKSERPSHLKAIRDIAGTIEQERPDLSESLHKLIQIVDTSFALEAKQSIKNTSKT